MNWTDSPLDPYEQIPALYDLEHAGFEDDLDFYASLVEAIGDPVLDLGCGTGRLLLPIARAGYRVTGLDLSRPMLDRAREFAHAEGLDERVTLFHGSMLDAHRAPGGPFGIAIIALNGLLHLTTLQEQLAALRSIRKALDPRGQLVLDLLNPSPDALRGFDHVISHDGMWTEPNGDRVDKFAARRVSHATQTIRTELWYDRVSPDGSLRRTTTSFDMRYIHRAELELMLELAGYVEWQVYGSYDLDPYDEASDRLIVAAEVTSSR
ncbi:MAG: class I SAM-dependent methyltransferase [Thermomicrobiales bacterium]